MAMAMAVATATARVMARESLGGLAGGELLHEAYRRETPCGGSASPCAPSLVQSPQPTVHRAHCRCMRCRPPLQRSCLGQQGPTVPRALKASTRLAQPPRRAQPQRRPAGKLVERHVAPHRESAPHLAVAQRAQRLRRPRALLSGEVEVHVGAGSRSHHLLAHLSLQWPFRLHGRPVSLAPSPDQDAGRALRRRRQGHLTPRVEVERQRERAWRHALGGWRSGSQWSAIQLRTPLVSRRAAPSRDDRRGGRQHPIERGTVRLQGGPGQARDASFVCASAVQRPSTEVPQ